mgnify:CR=1 FL=1
MIAIGRRIGIDAGGDDARLSLRLGDAASTGLADGSIDLVSLCAEGRIREFTVLARPPNAVSELKKEMMARVPIRLAKLKAKQALGLA